MQLRIFRPTRYHCDYRPSLLLGSWILATTILAASAQGNVIVSCGFESSGDTWQYTSSGKGFIGTNAGETDNQRIMAGTSSWSVAGVATSTLIFSDVLLSGWTSVSVTYHVSATADAVAKGKNPADKVQAFLAGTTETFGDMPNIVLQGRSNARWGFDSTSSYITQTAGADPIVVQPASGGLQTENCYSNYKINLPGGETSVAFKICAIGNTADTFWNLDEIAINGTASNSHFCEWNALSGTWNDSTAANWIDRTNANVPSAWNAVRGDNAYFTRSGSVTTIAQGTTVAARSLTFAVDGCLIQSGDSSARLALSNGGSGGGGANTIEVAANCTATINIPIVGNPGVGLTKTGAGTLNLNGNNFFTGDTVVREGTLVFNAKSMLRSSVIDVRSGATMDFSASGPYTLAEGVTLKGSGTVIGNLLVAGTHSPGNSMGIETIQGDYAMNGLLEMAIGGTTPGNNEAGYDQVLVAGDSSHNISLGGKLDLTWTGSGWSRPGDKLWILRNDTNGALNGVFSNYANGESVGSYDGRAWNIYYGADAATGSLTGGNDVALSPQPVPEPCVLGMLAVAVIYCLLFVVRLPANSGSMYRKLPLT